MRDYSIRQMMISHWMRKLPIICNKRAQTGETRKNHQALKNLRAMRNNDKRLSMITNDNTSNLKLRNLIMRTKSYSATRVKMSFTMTMKNFRSTMRKALMVFVSASQFIDEYEKKAVTSQGQKIERHNSDP